VKVQEFYDLYKKQLEENPELFLTPQDKRLFNTLLTLNFDHYVTREQDTLEKLFEYSIKQLKLIQELVTAEEDPLIERAFTEGLISLSEAPISEGMPARTNSAFEHFRRSIEKNPTPVINQHSAKSFLESLSPFLSSELKQELFENFIAELPKDYDSQFFGPNSNFQKIIRRLCDPDKIYIKNQRHVNNGIFNPESYKESRDAETYNYETHLVQHIFANLCSEEGFSELSHLLIAEANKKKDQAHIDQMKHLIGGHRFFDVINPLRRKVGILTNQDLINQFYDDELKSDLGYFYFKYDNDELDDDSSQYNPETLDTHNFFSYNPSHQLLKHAISSLAEGEPMSQEKILASERKNEGEVDFVKDIQLLSSKERNSLLRLVNLLPSNDLARDDRRVLHKFILMLAMARIEENKALAKFLSELVTKLSSDSLTRQVNPILENGIEVLAKENLGDETKQTIKAMIESYNSTSSEKEKKAIRNKLKAKLAELDIQQGHEAIQNFFKLIKVLIANQKLFTDSKYLNRLTELTSSQEQITGNTYLELHDSVIKNLTAELSDNAVWLSPEGIKNITDHVQAHPELWLDDNFFIDLLNYHSFQDSEAGKESTERLLDMLSQYQTSDGNTSQWLLKARENSVGLPETLEEAIHKPYTETYAAETLKFNQKEAYNTVIFNLLAHLGINSKDELLDRDFQTKFKTYYDDASFNKFMNLMGEIFQELEKVENIPMSTIDDWLAKAKSLNLRSLFNDWNEVITNINQIKIINMNSSVEITDAGFHITADPREIVRSGEKPFYTCQRIVDKTGQNSDGKPINRALLSHFFMAQATVNNDIDSRSILEIAKTESGEESVILAEALYTKSLVPAEIFYSSLVRWAKENTDVDYLIIPKQYCADLPRKEITMRRKRRSFPPR